MLLSRVVLMVTVTAAAAEKAAVEMVKETEVLIVVVVVVVISAVAIVCGTVVAVAWMPVRPVAIGTRTLTAAAVTVGIYFFVTICGR